MPVQAGGHHGNTSGTSVVVIVPAPQAGVSRIVKYINIHNADTAPATVTIRKAVKKTKGQPATYKIRDRVVATGADLEIDKIIVLEGPGERIEGLLVAATTTNELDFVSSWGDQS